MSEMHIRLTEYAKSSIIMTNHDYDSIIVEYG